MTTKKAVIIVVSVLAGLALVVALVVGSIFGFVFYTIGNSEAAQTAKTFLRTNEKLKQDIGEVRDFGFLITGDIKTRNSAGNAELSLKVIGERKTVDATVVMAYRAGREWRVVDAFYESDAGEPVPLTTNFDESAEAGEGSIGSSAGGVSEGGEITSGGAGQGSLVGGFDEESFRANVLEAELPVLVVIGSPASLETAELDKAIEVLTPKYADKVTLILYDLSEEPAALTRFDVKTVPTIMLYKNGREQERREGKISQQELAQLLDKHLEQ